MKRHGFTPMIESVLSDEFGKAAEEILASSPLLGYLNHKTASASRGSKSRGSFANHYALYVLLEDYLENGYGPGGKNAGKYEDYAGARLTDLFARQRQLPFGQKLQNHALNSRLNDEFRKYYPSVEVQPIVRDVASQRYWIQEDLLTVEVHAIRGKVKTVNLASAVIRIIDAYVAAKREAFESFIESCSKMSSVDASDTTSVIEFVRSQLQPEIDARVFEIVSFAILKAHYGEKQIFWGWSRNDLRKQALSLFKTGRTNANDGGIDFVMKPLGRFFQVTETIDVKKYFLDIDKIQRFPLTFVVKSLEDPKTILNGIKKQAKERYKINTVVRSYMDAIEEIINIPALIQCLEDVVAAGKMKSVMEEIILQSKVEFNYNG
jgi:hypothetical protein